MKNERMKLNDIDDSMQELFIKRMKIIKDIAMYKKANHLPVEDKKRETEMIERMSLDDPEMNGYYQSFLREMMRLSKTYQRRLIKGGI